MYDILLMHKHFRAPGAMLIVYIRALNLKFLKKKKKTLKYRITICIRHSSVAVIKHCDQRRHAKGRLYLGIWWWEPIMGVWGGEARQQEQSWWMDETSPLELQEKAERANWKWFKSSNLKAHLQWCGSFNNATLPKPPPNSATMCSNTLAHGGHSYSKDHTLWPSYPIPECISGR